MIDRSNLVFYEKRKNVKQHYECLGNTFYYNYEIMIDIQGNVLIEKTTNTIRETDYPTKKEVFVEINDNICVHPIILDVYTEILSTTYDLLQSPLEEQLRRIINLKNTDPLLVKLFGNELEQCRNKMNNYKIQSNLSKDLLTTYQAKISEMKKVIEENKNIHNDEVQKLMQTISTIYRHL